ncbi:MAG TPA: hypothetical protein VFN52_05250 [Acidiferrobacteraceae bacterium]|nr:hypothetical protein [Acidiferrobacteraceae bacterium]
MSRLAFAFTAEHRAAYAPLGPDVLAAVCFDPQTSDGGLPGLPLIQPGMPTLDRAASGCELLRHSGPLEEGQRGTFRYRCGPELLFGASRRPFPEGGSRHDRLETQIEQLYRELFAVTEELQYPHVLRVWNYVPNINEAEDGLERYRRFSIGRHNAFAARDQKYRDDPIPAASAVGTVGTDQTTVYFLAGRHPGRALENPRQVSAYHYPSAYGPRSPTFSRAMLATLERQELLLVSGTASIVGHRSQHEGDVVAQTRESLDNLRAVLTETGRGTAGKPYTLESLCYKVYVRNPADKDAIEQCLRGQVGSAAALFLRADICRKELLVEIEAAGVRDRSSHAS